MITKLLISGVAIACLTVGAASAKIRHHHHGARHGAAMTFAPPEQPIPYAELDHYLKASPRERASIAMAAGASTGSAANTAASAPAAAPATPDTSAAPATPAPATPETGAAPATPAPATSAPATPPPADTTPPK